MGARGPAPKRSDQRRRRNKAAIPVSSGTAGAGSSAPDADEAWHPVARRWFESLAESGQSVYYEPSDWATAFLVAESMSRDLSSGEAIKGSSLSAYLKAMTDLLVTEAARRRASIELQRGVDGTSEGGDPDVASMADYRSRLAGSG